MRSAGGVINDILDRKFDSKVERTKDRPIASGQIAVSKSIILLLILLILSFGLLLTMPIKTILICSFSLIFVFIYPLLKRFTYFPQVLLGFIFNIGLIAGFYAVSESINYSLFVLYIALILWTIIYDTLYAMQDIKDDVLIGVKSTAIKFGQNYKMILFILGVIYLLLLLLFWHINALNFIIIPYISCAILFVIIEKADIPNFGRMFKFSIIPCIIICIGIIINL